MRPTLFPHLVNGRFGDPALFVDLPQQGRALLVDCGDLHALPPRLLLRVDTVLVTHGHMDHLVGFDALLRANIGREAQIALAGPAGLADRIHHRLQGYEWDLAEGYAAPLRFEVTEFHAPGAPRPRARFVLQHRFRRETLPALPAETLDAAAAGTPPAGHAPQRSPVLLRTGTLVVTAATVRHHAAPCLAFAVAESAHVNVHRNRLEARGLPVGPWLDPLKRAVLAGLPADHPVPVYARPAERRDAPTLPLGALRDLVTLTPGQKLGWCTDLADTPENRAAVAALAAGADILFCEAAFAAADAPLAARRGHLTTTAAGEIARAARARRVEPFHFSPRYADAEAQLLAEVQAAFAG